MQIQLIQFKSLLHKATFRALNFWRELTSEQPGQKEVINALRLLVKSREEISFKSGILMGLPDKNLQEE